MTTMPEAAASSAAPQNDDVLLEVNNLKMHFPVGSANGERRWVWWEKVAAEKPPRVGASSSYTNPPLDRSCSMVRT